jgi:hypothetical protein
MAEFDCAPFFHVPVSVSNFSPRLRYAKEYVPAVGDLTVVVSRDELCKVSFKVRPVRTVLLMARCIFADIH